MTGVMSRSVVTLSALFLIACGLIPKREPPYCCHADLGSGRRRHPDVWHGAVSRCQHAVQRQLVSAQHDDPGNIHVSWSRFQQVPKSMQHLPDWLEMLAVSGLLPVAVLAVVLNLVLPEDAD